MGVITELVLEKGWKESVNNRFGYCLVVRFIDTETNKVLFRYAPLLDDKDFWGLSFNALLQLDALHKEYIERVRGLGVKFSSEVDKENSVGGCFKC